MTQEWQPIETAPTGKEALVYYPAEKSGRMMLKPMMAVIRVPSTAPRQPTHWMPIPEPPQ